MARRSIFGLLAVTGTFLLTSCGLFGGNRYRYKLIVEVETPEGPITGFAVRQVDWSAGRRITPEASTASMAHAGEAAIVDLPGREMLFALMSPDGQETPRLAFGSARQTTGSDRLLKVLTRPSRAEATYGESGYPRLVRFVDPNDPKTVELVDPANLAATFGEGYRLSRITAQIVDEPVTERIAARLKWLEQYRDRMLDGERYHLVQSPLLASHLNTLAFKREAV
ncbi:hypothetical protein [Novosphingobium sp.]|uniref:hypothetical protein n=1 Tax=Novosphingobium sp. TaxID=1874826 RepID=UPI0025E4DEE2|nr:hypothetical protein [Novosphingobium sp.]